MRLKEFIIFIVIFTACYILFFFLYDRIKKSSENKNQKKKIDAIMDANQYLLFAQFYGLSNGISMELLHKIYEDVQRQRDFNISTMSRMYQISPYEYVVALLYLEYNHLIDIKNISLMNDRIQPISSSDQEYIIKYGTYFYNKNDYSSIVREQGEKANQDLKNIQNSF